MKIAALVPARANSKRIPGKAIKPLDGRPLIAYTLAAAFESGVFTDVVVASDSRDILDIATQLQPSATRYLRNHSGDNEPDIQWVSQVLHRTVQDWDAFSILRPTAPFRTAETIQRAWIEFRCFKGYDSLRAMEPCSQHPAKMWQLVHHSALPLLLQPTGTPWHSSPTQILPKVYVQNASLEIAWTDTVRRTGTIAGDRILAFETQGFEGVDINSEKDWVWAEHLVATGQATLPEVR